MPPPQEGELVIIQPGQHIYLDTSTPILKGIIIQGGSLIFDDLQDINLNCEYILITDGGKFQVGTLEQPFQHKAVYKNPLFKTFIYLFYLNSFRIIM